MFIAQELRKKSTAEFVLYMWQVEDIIRAYGCQLSRIKNEYISRFANYTDEQREEMVDWYGDLITMMNSEGKREKGHLTINQIVVQDMNETAQPTAAKLTFPILQLGILPCAAIYSGAAQPWRQRLQRDRNLPECAIRHYDAAPTEQDHKPRHTACNKGDFNLIGHAERLLHQRQD